MTRAQTVATGILLMIVGATLAGLGADLPQFKNTLQGVGTMSLFCGFFVLCIAF